MPRLHEPGHKTILTNVPQTFIRVPACHLDTTYNLERRFCHSVKTTPFFLNSRHVILLLHV